MTEPEAYDFLTACLRRIFERDDITATPELAARDVFGWDSFKQVELLMEIQDDLNIEFTSEEMDNLENVGALARIVLTHANAAA